jgi:hypothetical protein
VKAAKRGCGSCRFADWRRGPQGPRSKGPGDCTFEPVLPALPDAVTKAHGWRREWSRMSIWKDQGAECPCWVAADAVPAQ